MLCNIKFTIIFIINVKTSLSVNFVSNESTTRVKKVLLSLDYSIFNTQLTKRATKRWGGGVVSTTINDSNFIFFKLAI